MSIPPIPELPQEAWFNPASSYSARDIGLITQAQWAICNEIRNRLSPYVNMTGIYKGLRIEFDDFQTQELKENSAIGLAYMDRNVILKSHGVAFFDLIIDSGIMSMEAFHTVLGRLTNNRYIMNDVCHYLYNAGRLITVPIRNDNIHKMLGQDMQVVIPDVVYGWLNQDKIIYEIKAGVAPQGKNVYWTTANTPVDFAKPIAAQFHERVDIQKWLGEQGII